MKTKKYYNLFSLQKRFLFIILVFIILFVGIGSRLFYLQIIQGKTLQIRATSQWLRDLPLASKRGEIYDCNGVVLATTKTTYDVYVRARNVEDPSAVAKLLVDKLNLNYDKVYKKTTNLFISESLIKMQVAEDLALQLINSGLKGIYLSQNVARVYPFSDLLTQVLGYCSIDNFGQTGIENYYDKYLKGIAGKSYVQSNAQGKELENTLDYYLPSIPGSDIKLTIDVQIQTLLEKELNQAYLEHKAMGAWGIVLDVTNGEILGMSNLPSFDLNNVPRSDLQNLNLLSKNSCVVDVYEPGSTFKILTMLASLNEGLTDVDEHFYCSGSCTADGQKIKCWKTTGHGSQTLVEGFKNSCNCVFVNLALRLGTERLYKYLNMLGIGQKTGVDIKSESGGIIINQKNVKTVDLARIGFGQSVAVTLLQMARMVGGGSTGILQTPHILKEIDMKNQIIDKTYDSFKTELRPEVISIVNNMLFNNINADEVASFVAGYDVGGKTGTAQKFVNGAIAQGKYVSSFFGVYPTKSPKYVVIVCVNEPSNGVYYGGLVAKPIGQKIFTELFKIKSIPADFEDQISITPSVVMPNLIGLSLSEGLAKLKTLELVANLDGTGEFITSQLPLADTKIFVGEEVLVCTN